MHRSTCLALISSAVSSSDFAKAPYSEFQVGASLLTQKGDIFTGCNIESSSYGLTICAERVALFKALSEGYTSFSALAIYAKNKPFCPPCGACLQVLHDYAKNITIILTDGRKYKEIKISELLPFAFDEKYLDHHE